MPERLNSMIRLLKYREDVAFHDVLGVGMHVKSEADETRRHFNTDSKTAADTLYCVPMNN